jgi:hypothetical protein
VPGQPEGKQMSGYIIFGIVFTLCQLRGEFTKPFILNHLSSIMMILRQRLDKYQGLNPR